MRVRTVFLFFGFILFYSSSTFSQQRITWKELSIAYRSEIFPNESNDKITLSLKDIEGKQITVRGYFLDLGADSMWFMLSRFPFENCFFCTGVGPETVIELGGFENEKSKFKTDDIVTATGTLYLVKEEDEYFYILKNCSVIPTEF
ncbi:MAG: hypothetical protein BM563_09830 [Bacteroidetes bacterium MedPE-SWsnd-G1]|nr:MAG: hypothetical protein BM563_09830 [Bacteroidetes bacterium MedPE-SWsnd-G1]